MVSHFAKEKKKLQLNCEILTMIENKSKINYCLIKTL
jgi:hypothetical protein